MAASLEAEDEDEDDDDEDEVEDEEQDSSDVSSLMLVNLLMADFTVLPPVADEAGKGEDDDD